MDINDALKSLSPDVILGHLSNVAQIPNADTYASQRLCVAGQSVASAVMELLGISTRGAYNDVDVFISNNKKDALGKNPIRTALRLVEPELCYAGYEGVLTISKGAYSVTHTERDALLNRIYYTNPISMVDNATQSIIRGFDLNCVQIGIDLNTNQLIWTPQFVDFLETWELKVDIPYTPYHTAIRYFDKKRILKCYGSDVTAMATCAVPHIVGMLAMDRAVVHDTAANTRVKLRGVNNAVDGIVLTYGSKYHDKIQQDTELCRWFKEEEYKHAAISKKVALPTSKLWTMRPVFDMAHHSVLQRISDAYADMHLSAEMVVGTVGMVVANAVCRQSVTTVTRRERVLKQVARAIPANAGDRQRGNVQKYFRMQVDLNEPAFMPDKNTISDRAMKGVVDALCSHPGVVSNLGNKSLVDIYKFVSTIDQLSKQYGDWVYGVAEDHLSSRCYADDVDNALHKIGEQVESEHVALNRQLIQPLVITADNQLRLYYITRATGIKIMELTTSGELKEEGKAMHHCVGGYASAVEQGRSRIFKLRSTDGAHCSTLEIVTASGRFRIAQHRAKCNGDPSTTSKLAARGLVACLNIGKPPPITYRSWTHDI